MRAQETINVTIRTQEQIRNRKESNMFDSANQQTPEANKVKENKKHYSSQSGGKNQQNYKNQKLPLVCTYE
jgi:hypothetical protein